MKIVPTKDDAQRFHIELDSGKPYCVGGTPQVFTLCDAQREFGSDAVLAANKGATDGKTGKA